MMKTNLKIRDLGLISYEQAYKLQMEAVKDVQQGGEQQLLLCEHPKTITCGRLTDQANLLLGRESLHTQGFEVFDIDRGGDVTLHAPGQLIVYPILDLNKGVRDLHLYLHKLEQVGIYLLAQFDIISSRLDGKTGVFVGSKKIISCGIGVKKWVTFHGIGINVATELALFDCIRPCGLDVQMTSIVECCRCELESAMLQVKEKVIDCFRRVFPLEFLDSTS